MGKNSLAPVLLDGKYLHICLTQQRAGINIIKGTFDLSIPIDKFGTALIDLELSALYIGKTQSTLSII